MVLILSTFPSDDCRCFIDCIRCILHLRVPVIWWIIHRIVKFSFIRSNLFHYFEDQIDHMVTIKKILICY